MASVQELKDALSADREQAAKTVDMAMSAIDTLLALSAWVLVIFTAVLAILGLFGWWLIYKSAHRKIEQIAAQSLTDYLKSDTFREQINGQLKEAIERRLQDTMIIPGLCQEPRQDIDDLPFPEAENQNDTR